VVEEAGDVGEEGAVVMGSRFGQPNRDGSEEEPEPGKEQGVSKRKAAREEQQGAVRGMVESNRVREGIELSVWYKVCSAAAAGIRRKSRHGGGKRALESAWSSPGRRARSA
jgi:hypothetical protein